MMQNETHLDYHRMIAYMKDLRSFFHRELAPQFDLGKINHGSPDYTYFSLTPDKLKKQKLKFVIILDHQSPRFEICLSGRNKAIRKEYWEVFRSSNESQYHLVESIENSLSIIEHVLVENPDFANQKELTRQIKSESLNFMNEVGSFSAGLYQRV